MAFVFLSMKKTLTALFAIGLVLQSCMKKDCTIRDPFTTSEIANYKCKSNCKTDAEIIASVQCLQCITEFHDTIETCDKAFGDSLLEAYTLNTKAGHCDKIDAKLDCGN